ncbi:ABC transporter substrate-binding protein [Corticibacter populi]|nr:ABC transporter substrate-binding protein [Corticibacter populi]
MKPLLMRRRGLLAAGLLAPFAGVLRCAHGAQAQAPSLLSPFGPAVVPRPGRVFAAGPPAAVLVAALAPQALLGWPQKLTDEARGMLSTTLAGLPVTGRLAGRGSTLSIEALLALQPDLIVDAGTVDEHYRSTAARVAQQTGIPYVLVDGRLAQSPRQLRELGQWLGVPGRAEALARYADETLALARHYRAQAGRRPVAAYLARGVDGLETGWAGSINAELLELMGMRNVADSGGGGNLGHVGQVSLEQLLNWDPELILTQQPGLAAQLLQVPAWRSLRAVRSRQVLQVPYLPFGWVDGPPGINRLIGLRWLAAVLDGLAADGVAADAAAPEGPVRSVAFEAQARHFCALFYGTPDDAVWPSGALP